MLRPSHILEADPSHSQLHLRLSRTASDASQPGASHPSPGLPMAADALLVQCVRLSTEARGATGRVHFDNPLVQVSPWRLLLSKSNLRAALSARPPRAPRTTAAAPY